MSTKDDIVEAAVAWVRARNGHSREVAGSTLDALIASVNRHLGAASEQPQPAEPVAFKVGDKVVYDPEAEANEALILAPPEARLLEGPVTILSFSTEGHQVRFEEEPRWFFGVDRFKLAEPQPTPVTEDKPEHYIIKAGDFDPESQERLYVLLAGSASRWSWDSAPVAFDHPKDAPMIVRDKTPEPPASLWTATQSALTRAMLLAGVSAPAGTLETATDRITAAVIDVVSSYYWTREAELEDIITSSMRDGYATHAVLAVHSTLFGDKP